MEFNIVLHPNEPPQKIFWYLVKEIRSKLPKVGHFPFSKQIVEAKNLLSLTNNDFFIKISIQENNIFRTTFSIFLIFKKNHLINICPIFDGSDISCHTTYLKCFHWDATTFWIPPDALWYSTTLPLFITLNCLIYDTVIQEHHSYLSEQNLDLLSRTEPRTTKR